MVRALSSMLILLRLQVFTLNKLSVFRKKMGEKNNFTWFGICHLWTM